MPEKGPAARKRVASEGGTVTLRSVVGGPDGTVSIRLPPKTKRKPNEFLDQRHPGQEVGGLADDGDTQKYDANRAYMAT